MTSAPEIVALGYDGTPRNCATKICSGTGLETLRRWLDGATDAVFLHNGGSGQPVVLVSWSAWNRAVRTVVRGDIPDEPRQPGYNHSVLANNR
jgi:hypothetical protein